MKFKNMKKIFLVIFVGLLFFSPEAKAQLFLEEGKKVHTIAPGERVTGSLMVNNTSERTIRIKAYWEDFQYISPFDGAKKFLPAGTAEKSFSSWAVFKPREFELVPYGKVKIDYTFDVPENATGGYYGVLFFENITDSFVDKTGVNVVTRAGCLFFLEPENKNKRSAVENIVIENDTVKGEIVNEGDVVLIPSGTYYVLNRENVAQDRGEINKLYLPPDGRGNFSFKIKDFLAIGDFTAVVTFDLDGDVIVREIDFSKDISGHIKLLNVRE